MYYNVTIEGRSLTIKELGFTVTMYKSTDPKMTDAEYTVYQVVRNMMKNGEAINEPVTKPVDGYVAVALYLGAALKIKMYNLWRVSGVTKTALSVKLGSSPQLMSRLFDLTYKTRCEEVTNAINALGYNLRIDCVKE